MIHILTKNNGTKMYLETITENNNDSTKFYNIILNLN